MFPSLLVIVIVLTSACLVHAQLTLPILSDPSFKLLSGEIIVSQQLNSWGVKLGPISLNLGLDLSSLGLSKRQESRSRSSQNVSVKEANEKRLLGLDLGLLNLGLNLGGTKSAITQSTQSQGQAKSKALINLDLGVDLSDLDILNWGDGDNVVKGERGDTEWFTYISVGTPPQSIPVLSDTGSSDLFIFGPDCVSCQLSNHTYYEPIKSSTWTNGSASWMYGYADGSGAIGYTSSDVISFSDDVGLFSKSSFSTNMNFAIATEVVGSDFGPSKRSGVMGLGLDPMSTLPSNQGSTLFSRLVKSNSLVENILGIRLEKGQQNQGVVTQEGGGQYTLGGIEENYVVGGRNGLTWTNVGSQNYWGITMEDVSVGSQSALSQDTTTPRRAIIDTGTTLIITSNTASSLIHAHIFGSWQDPRSSIWYIPCTTSYPSTGNVFFTISGRKFGVPISDLAWKKSSQIDGMCISGVQGGMEGFTVLGDMFIKNHYVVLSYGNDGNETQVGLGDRTDVAQIL
ncbi:uncharacterized protein IL334_000620 [Kwoniella shivajii]|uniref:Peptidase A1 domain-containing protein n=1 Tax=Kwoniella shivajii TaxID=564305 RepID=A0ABZ1CPM5_9TREE|nr:hypothetical protein IL334_000620 [Kwoniella shivajii]